MEYYLAIKGKKYQHTQQPRCISWEVSWEKKASLKRLHTKWFHLCIIHDMKKNTEMDNRLMVAGDGMEKGDKTGKGGQKVQTSVIK